MKIAIKFILIAALLAAIATAAYFTWSNYFGTALNNRIRVANAAASTAREAAGRIDAAAKKAKTYSSVWAELSFDEASEVTRILEDANNNRGYKVDVLRDASAAKIQKDIISAETELKSAIADVKKSVKTIDGVKGYLPAARRADYQTAKDNSIRAAKKGEALVAELQELKYDVDVWGFFSISLRINGIYMASFNKVSSDLAAGDYASAGAGARDILNGINESVTWLSMGKQELTNISVYSKDSDKLLAFISRAKSTAEAFNNASTCGLRGDIEQAKTGMVLSEKDLAQLKKTQVEQSIGTDFKTWFLAQAERRL